MEDTKSDAAIKNDVLHSEDHSKLTPEEIAKAVAHHNRHHQEKVSVPKSSEQAKKQGEKPKK